MPRNYCLGECERHDGTDSGEAERTYGERHRWTVTEFNAQNYPHAVRATGDDDKVTATNSIEQAEYQTLSHLLALRCGR